MGLENETMSSGGAHRGYGGYWKLDNSRWTLDSLFTLCLPVSLLAALLIADTHLTTSNKKHAGSTVTLIQGLTTS